MDDKDNPSILNDRFQNILQGLAKCKIDFNTERDEIKKIREANSKLEVELTKARELEKSHRYHLQTSREMIGNLQETVSQLVYLKRDVNKLKEEISIKDSAISGLENERKAMVQKHNEYVAELRAAHEKQIEEITAVNERKIQQVQHDSDNQIAQFTCVIEELRSKIQEMETEHRDKMNVVVLDYEEKIQRGASHVAQLQEELARQSVRTEANIDAYRRRLEELEKKLKESKFKQYLAQTSYPEYENQVERPYSVDRDVTGGSAMNPVVESPKQLSTPNSYQNRTAKPNTLQVLYYGNKTPNPNDAQRNEKKGPFNIGKKRKLYSEKEFSDF